MLLKKLVAYQCDEHSVTWFKFYLQNRQQCIKFKNKCSTGKYSRSFTVYHFYKWPASPCELITWYVCWWLHNGCEWETMEHLENKIIPAMKKVDTWCESNRIATNCYKTNVMLITIYQKETKLHRYKGHLSKQRTRKCEFSKSARCDLWQKLNLEIPHR